MNSVLKLDCPFEDAVRNLTQGMEGQGFRVVRSFDLHDALSAGALPCPCRHHGTERCTCSYTVMLIYAQVGGSRSSLMPYSIALHSHDGETWLTLLPTWEFDPSADDQVEAVLGARLVRGLAKVLLPS